MSSPQKQSQDGSFFAKTVKVAGVVGLYWFVSISMVFLNAHLLSGVSLQAPMFVTWFQCVVPVIVCYVLGHFRTAHPLLESFPKYEYNLEIAKQILPLSMVFVGMIAFNNLCLKFVGVAFYNVGRSLTTVFNVVLTYVFLHTTTSFKALGTCAIIIVGFFVGVDQEDSSTGGISYMGVFFGVAASICVALNAIFIKKVLPLVDSDTWRLLAYNNTNAVFLFLPVIIFLGEGPEIASSPLLYSGSFWFMMVLGGIFGIAIGLVTMLQIQVTSPLTHNISGTAKACAQTILALQFSGEVKSGMWWMSNFMVLGGSMAYTLVRREEMRVQHEQQQQQQQNKPSQGP